MEGGVADEYADSAFGNDAMFVAQAKRFLFNWTADDTVESLDAAAGSLAIAEAARRSMLSGCAEFVDSSFVTTHNGQ